MRGVKSESGVQEGSDDFVLIVHRPRLAQSQRCQQRRRIHYALEKQLAVSANSERLVDGLAQVAGLAVLDGRVGTL